MALEGGIIKLLKINYEILLFILLSDAGSKHWTN